MTTLIIANAPDDMIARLRRRAARHRTSVSAEVLEILDGTLIGDDYGDEPFMTPAEVYARIKARGFPSPDESTAMIREDRDRADGRH